MQQGLVRGVEGIEGTGELVRRCGDYKRKGEGGVLVKIRKPQQDMRVALPMAIFFLSVHTVWLNISARLNAKSAVIG